ncbi:RecB family exonuclease [Schaalia suimastitidis]|uniref:RecB family exonuclease n=1 Tax=Schaalia suimastitidis TaxID=121163 RepID=UPI00040EB984|nr:PD-(D/E)XK nuclease family protein [Schaalia suimastitidis]
MTNPAQWEPALSASRAKEYQRCPLQYRLHVVDGIKEPPTRATALGTMVHAALEHLYALPPEQRTPEATRRLLDEAWAELCEKDPQVRALFAPSSHDDTEHLQEAYELINSYFGVENPQRLAPSACEQLTEATTPGGVRLRGIIDRVDRAPSGAIRVVDYKTGKAPSPRYIEDALYQMRFYALLMLLKGELPARLQLLYMRSQQVLTLDPKVEDIESFGLGVERLWEQIESDASRGYFAPRRNPLCQWCGVQASCPVFGGTIPPLPENGIARLLRTRVAL